MSSAFAVPVAVGGEALIVGFVLLMFVVLAYSYYTIKGSAIDAHPSDGLDGAPGSEGPSEVAGGRTSDDRPGTERSFGDTFSSRGTK